MAEAYLLTTQKDGNTVKKGITDCVTKKPLASGDRVVVCKKCKLAGVYLQENWSGSCMFCKGTEVMSFPNGMDAVFFKSPKPKPPIIIEPIPPVPGPPVPGPHPSVMQIVLTAGAAVAALLLLLAFLARGCSSNSGDDSSQVQSQSSASQTKPSLSSVIPSDAVSFGGHSYKYYSISLSWTEAEKYCTGLGGHLISINSADEQSFAEQLSSGAEAVNIWIGGYRLPNDGWAWSDGSVFSYTNWDIYPDAEGEMYIKPDNYWGNEDYIRYSNYSMTYDEWVANKGKWDDTANRADGYSGDVPISSFGFICEWGG